MCSVMREKPVSRPPPITCVIPQTCQQGPSPGPFGFSGDLVMTKKKAKASRPIRAKAAGGVAGLVGIDGGVVSGVINLESSGVEAPD